jgi:group I intron endonuclease
MIGIYKITNKENNKIYIGKSENITRRWHEHQRVLHKGLHHSDRLQSDFNKYGITAFMFEVIEICKKDELDYKEQEYIYKFEVLNPNFGYNIQGSKDVAIKQFYKDKSEKYVLNIDKYLKLDMTDTEKFMLLYLIVNTSKKGYVMKSSNIIATQEEIMELLKMNISMYKKLRAKIINNNVFKFDEKHNLVLCDFDLCKKVYEYKRYNDDYVYIYKDYISFLYENIKTKTLKTLVKLFKLSSFTNRNSNVICDLNYIYDEEVKEQKHKYLTDILTKSGVYDSNNYKRFITFFESNKILNESLLTSKDGLYYINPRLFHYTELLTIKDEIEEIFKIS